MPTLDWPKQKYSPLYALRQGWLWLLASLLVLAWLSLSFAYVQTTGDHREKFRWDEKTVTFSFRLGCRNVERIEAWGPCWDDVAQHALETWNNAGSQFRFDIDSAPSTARASCTRDDQTHVVVWGDTICGQAFGLDTLAITRNWTWPDGTMTDSDIVFNTTFEWAAYAGPWRFNQPDLHRIAIHEGGHALGLAHPDDHGQRVAAIMNRYAGDTETLQPDDREGAQAIYGRDATVAAPLKGALGNPGHRSFRSGVGVISGWVCDAEQVVVRIGRTSYRMVYETDRPDTAYAPDGTEICGDTNNGFVTLFNYNTLGPGTHTARLLVDGRPLGPPHQFKVTTFGTEFLRGASGQYEIAFPTPGDTTVLGWDQGSQNFVVRERR